MKKDNDRLVFISYLVSLIFIIILGYYSYRFINIGLHNDKKVIVNNYSSNSTIDYKVYLLKNNFFTEPYLGMNRTYIASLIDYLDVTFNYSIDFDKPISGNYVYYIRATILADKDDASNTNYWSKSYNLTNLETVELANQDNYDMTASIKVDYQNYSKLLRDFRNQYGLSVDGKLKLELVVDTTGKSDDMNNGDTINAVSTLTIPLTEQAIELSIDSNNESRIASLVDTEDVSNIKYILFLCGGVLVAIFDLICLIIVIRFFVRYSKSQSKYGKELKRILNTYDSVIVNVVKFPKLDNYKIINVSSFQELIDAHSEVRMPINYIEIEPNKKCKFVLLGTGIAWVYLLEKEKSAKKRIKNSK